MTAIVGIFVGGRGSRMGGVAKGLLNAPNNEQTLVERLTREVRAALPDADLVLVGKHPEYADLELPIVPDARAGQGPLGGLVGLLASGHQRGCSEVYALACDLPYLTSASIVKLAAQPAAANAVAPRRGKIWEPLVARYAPGACLSVARARLDRAALSLQGLLDELGASAIELPDDELRDWDTPGDLEKAAKGPAARQ